MIAIGRTTGGIGKPDPFALRAEESGRRECRAKRPQQKYRVCPT
jgi:hypothetical protein